MAPAAPGAPATPSYVGQPYLRWLGGKAKLVQHIDPLLGPGPWPLYVEPFLGAGSVFFGLAAAGRVPADCRLSDVNPRLIECHRAVRDDVEGVLGELAKLPWGPEYVAEYVPMRARFNEGPQEGTAHAARFIWLNKHCFNGLYRENSKGGMNAHVGLDAKGGPKVVGPPNPDHLRWCSQALQRASLLTCCPFRAALAPDLMVHNARIYCDPPYVPRNITGYDTFVSYSGGGFGPTEQTALAGLLLDIAFNFDATVVASNHDLPVVRQLYEGFAFHELSVRRSVSRTAEGRGKVGELLMVKQGMTAHRVDVHTIDVVQQDPEGSEAQESEAP